jgi:hypothetical protein
LISAQAFPGPSWPNHMFSYSATANGNTNTGDGYLCQKDRPYPQRTIFDALLDAGHEYVRIYNDSITDTFMEAFASRETRSRTHTMDRFFSDAAKGTLPALTWIDPRQGINKTLGNLGGPNSDHPSCCDVALGERMPVWKSTSASGARAVRNRHRHAIEQASRRWRGGRRDDSARTRHKVLISTQAPAQGHLRGFTSGPRLEPHCIHHDLGRPRWVLRPRAAADGRPAAGPPARVLLL